MRTFSETRSRCQERSKPLAGLVTLAACLAIAAALVPGCSDDVVCGEDITPYVSARVEQLEAARAGSTHVEVYLVGDPLPGQLVVTVTGRQLPQAQEAPDRPGLYTALNDTQVIWQPGTNCVLEVTSGSGISTATEPVPAAVAVTAPDTVSLNENLAISWTESEDADYYLVLGTVDGAGEQQDIEIAVDGSGVTFDAGELEVEGLLSGRVWAVSGPFPQSGSAGNVTGDGWGYLSVLYAGPSSDFEVTVRDTVPEGAAPRPVGQSPERSASRSR